jgi:release factor glutamine methyltransferase
MNSKALFNQLVDRIALMETTEEKQSIVFILIENKFGLSQTDILTEKEFKITPKHEAELEKIVARINSNEPIQYILNEAVFYKRKFYVNPAVLIPRPETEELVRHIIQHIHAHPFHDKPYRDYGNIGKESSSALRVLDIGTGSGCIPITLKLEIPGAELYAIDINDSALDVAKRNAFQLSTSVNFIAHDILTKNLPIYNFDVIVSNPPYVTQGERETMKKNVLDFEPHLALFVPKNDPLIFYDAIANAGLKSLKPGGRLFVEINEKLGAEVISLFHKIGYHDGKVLNDINDKPRVVTAIR